MKSIKNRIQLIGRVGRDPEFRLLIVERMWLIFQWLLATAIRMLQAKDHDTQWHQVVAWGGLAEIADKYLRKGSEVAVQGKLIHRNYEVLTATDGMSRKLLQTRSCF